MMLWVSVLKILIKSVDGVIIAAATKSSDPVHIAAKASERGKNNISRINWT